MTDALAKTGFEPTSMSEAMALATQLAQSSLIPQHLRGKPADVLVTLITGRELGLSPMQAIRGMYVVSGKAAMSADLMVALAVRHSDVCEYFRIVESTGTTATYETMRRGAPEPTKLTFTLAQAKAAGLLGNQTWSKYPDAMLRARCASALVRAVYPDLLAGVYDADSGELPGRPEAPAAVDAAPVTKRKTSARVEVIEDAKFPDATLAADLAASLETPHNPTTGEVVDAAAPLLAAIADGFKAVPHWTAWGKKHASEIKALSEEAQARVRTAYKAAKPTLPGEMSDEERAAILAAEAAEAGEP